MTEIDRLVPALKVMFDRNLASKPGEDALVFTDLVGPDETMDKTTRDKRDGLVTICRAAARAAGEVGLKVRYLEYPALGSHGTEPGEPLWRLAFGDNALDELAGEGLLEAIQKKRATPGEIGRAREVVRSYREEAVDLVVALSNYSTSHTRFRDLLTSETGARYASMPLFEADMLFGPMDVDWTEVRLRTLAVVEALRGMETARVTTPEGTDISFSIKGRETHPDTGVLDYPGAFSNLPAGEAYVAPIEGTANGRLVIAWSPAGRLKSPITVTVKNGAALLVEGEDPYTQILASQLKKRSDNSNIAELGIGTNDRAKRPDSILESEKILGTVHIAFGDNSSMGGRVSTPYHQDFVYFRPTLTISGPKGELRLIEDGKLLAW